MERFLSSPDVPAAYVEDLGLPVRSVAGGLQIDARLDGRPSCIHVTWQPEPGWVRAELRLPIQVAPSRRDRVVAEVVRIKAEIALIGFVLTDDGVYFVSVALFESDGTISSRAALRTIRLCAEESAYWLDSLAAAAEGA